MMGKYKYIDNFQTKNIDSFRGKLGQSYVSPFSKWMNFILDQSSKHAQRIPKCQHNIHNRLYIIWRNEFNRKRLIIKIRENFIY